MGKHDGCGCSIAGGERRKPGGHSQAWVAGHGGSWKAGVGGAKTGLLIPGTNLLGARFQQETAPGVAMDRSEISSMDDTVTTPAGTIRP